MTTSDPTAQTLEQLGVKTLEAVGEKFAEVRQRFDDQSSLHFSNRENWQIFLVKWTGRKSGVLSQITNNWLKMASPELKPVVGQELNKLKAHIESIIAERQRAMEAASEQSAAARDKIDLSLPGIERSFGTRHLIRQTFEELQQIFIAIGFSVVQGPEIETPYYNFEALNIPEHHPARDNMDTFYIEGVRNSHLLRTHTSPMQIRTMEKEKPPVRIVVPGKVYRRDNPDATHGYMFHQIEGLAVDTDITFCDFKGTVEYFAREFLGPKTKTRLRPSYFPFTEPSRSGRHLPRVRWERLPRLQIFRMDRTFWRRHGESCGVRLCEIRSRAAFRLCLRHGCGSLGHDEVRRHRGAATVSERFAFLAAVSLERALYAATRHRHNTGILTSFGLSFKP